MLATAEQLTAEQQVEDVPMWVQCRRFLLEGIEAGQSVLDVGCGHGELMQDLLGRGCQAVGVEIAPELVKEGLEQGRVVVKGVAENLPFPDEKFDAIVSSVVLPYTDERRALAEFARVLKPGGIANITGHGIGYGLCMIHEGDWRKKIYGVRMLLNTGWYRMTGYRLPGIMGDTLCERVNGMRSMAKQAGLELVREQYIGTCVGSPRFLAQSFRKI